MSARTPKLIDVLALILGIASVFCGGAFAWLVWLAILPGVYAIAAVALWGLSYLLLCGWLGWRNPFFSRSS